MKSFLLLLLSIVFLQNINAQSLLDESNIWNVQVSPLIMAPFVTTLRINGEKEINGQMYAIVEENDGSGWQENNYYIREGSDNKYYAVYSNDPEYLLYDFNLEVGENFEKGNSWGSNCIGTVTSVDLITLNDGSERKRWKISYPGAGVEEEIWIEGIGSDLGLANHNTSCYTDHPYNLLCYWIDEEVEFTVDQTQCTLLSTPDHRENGSIRINPNPFSEHLNINSETQNISSIEIFNSNGAVILKSSEFEKGINTGTYPPGIYIVKAITTNKEVLISRVIKQ